ncbi:MAG: RdgB/HAM1 family non-canonical purine NTP pyrophosphatase [Saprospiraceae bacterium]|nr:RdgB/HAM1 family non-canonical purine NTP pyrophosphatase [Saprospiraceae bacterium]MBK8817971.1 RdgB/HAM1 family non-canonical purine NTP pyrophosphatase [Saprospiraceae bacterium]
MTELIFATKNINKSSELKEILHGTNYKVLDLNDLGFNGEIDESGSTIHDNAKIKAFYLYEKTQKPSLSEDTGLEVDELEGEPGVYSARYAGLQRSDADNVNKLLEKMKQVSDRSAQFRTVIALATSENVFYFEGIVRGKIAESPMGHGGFGYDPVFIPKGYDKTFGELSKEIKNKISHRAKAVEKLIEFLTTEENQW